MTPHPIRILSCCLISALVFVSGCTAPGESMGAKRSAAPGRLAVARKKSKRASADESSTPSPGGGEFARPAAPSYAAARQPPPSPAAGLYALEEGAGFDTLDGVAYDPAEGTLSLTGHRARSDGAANLRYLDLLAAALDSNRPVLSLEWTPASQREVDRAMAFYGDDRNNGELTTRLAHIFDAKGRLNRRGAAFFRALGVNVREGMSKYEFNGAMLVAAGRENAGEALRTFGNMVEAIKRGDHSSSYLEDLARALGLYDFIAGKAEAYRNGQIAMADVMDAVMPRLLTGLAQAFGWDDSPYVNKYWRLRQSGHSYEAAGDEALYDVQVNLNTLPRQALDAITARTTEIVVPPETMREVLEAEPRVRPVLSGLPDRSRLALVACEADAFCKTLFDMPGLRAKVPRYQGYFAWLRDRGQHPSSNEGHLWISPGDFELFESTDSRSLQFGRTPMSFHIERYASGRRSVADPQLSAYADLLTACYDDIAREYPVLHQLRECTKVVAVAQWLRQRGYRVALPRTGREAVNLPVELPGVIYMVMAVKQGPVGEILTAAGGIDYSGDRGWRYAPKDLAAPPTDFVDQVARQTREQVEQIFGRRIEAPEPRPVAAVTHAELDGRRVTTVTVATDAGAAIPDAGVEVTRTPDENAALRLWKAGNLQAAADAYQKLIDGAADNPRYAAALRALRARILLEMGKTADALRELDEATCAAPDLLVLQYLHAQALAESGDLAKADEVLRHALGRDPNNVAALRLHADLQRRLAGGRAPEPGPTAPAPVTVGTSVLEGPMESDKARPWAPDYRPEKPVIAGRGPEWPRWVRDDLTIVKLERTRDEAVAAREKLDEEAGQIQRQIDATADVAKRTELTATVEQLKAQSVQAEQQAAAANDTIQKRAKLLIDTHVEEAPPESGAAPSPPAEAPRAGP